MRRFRFATSRRTRGVTLAEFRDAFPSKGAVLGGLNRLIDRARSDQNPGEVLTASTRDRLFEALMRRIDAMAPYKAGLREVVAWLKRDPISATQINRAILNSMRFVLEAAGVDSEGAAGALKLQGLAFAWSRIVDVWLEDDDEGLSRTMAAVDSELTRGERSGSRRGKRSTASPRRCGRSPSRRSRPELASAAAARRRSAGRAPTSRERQRLKL